MQDYTIFIDLEMNAFVYSHTTLIGSANLRLTDISMGVVSGILQPETAYFKLVQPAVWRFWESKPDYDQWSGLRLNIQLENGCFLLPLGGYTIEDTREFPDAPFVIHAAGIYRFIITGFFQTDPPLSFLHAPWESLSVKQKITFEDELQWELSANKKHALTGYIYEALAKDTRSDEVLFVLWRQGGTDKDFARVHLTWKTENDPRWPATQFFEDFEAFKKMQMLPGAAEWED
jgi:hypothetical protein